MSRLPIEQLRGYLEALKRDSEYLYRYGGLSGNTDFFPKLSDQDKRRLIFLAFIEGDKDINNVAHFLMGRLKPNPGSLRGLFLQMRCRDKKEAKRLLRHE